MVYPPDCAAREAKPTEKTHRLFREGAAAYCSHHPNPLEPMPTPKTASFTWQRTYPRAAGWYFYRESDISPIEVIHVWDVRDASLDFPNYGWARPPKGADLFLAKRMHEPSADASDTFPGFYQCAQGTHTPVPITLPSTLTPRAKAKARKVKAEKVAEPVKAEEAEA